MPDTLAKFYVELQGEVLKLNRHWILLHGVLLDDFGPRKTPILRAADPFFFSEAMYLFHDSILLISARLLDPAKDRKNENLSFLNFIDKATISASDRDCAESRCVKIADELSAIRIHRNKRIGHNDLNTKIGVNSLPRLEVDEVWAVISKINELMNFLAKSALDYPYADYSKPFSSNYDPSRLLDLIDKGLSVS